MYIRAAAWVPLGSSSTDAPGNANGDSELVEEGGDGFSKDLLLRDRVEQRRAGPEFQLVWRAKDIGYGLFACSRDEACAFDQARPEQAILQVSDGLGARAERSVEPWL
jgi:hypothetical protein